MLLKTSLLRRADGDPTIFFGDWHVIHWRIQKPFFISWANVGAKNFWSPLIDNPFKAMRSKVLDLRPNIFQMT